MENNAIQNPKIWFNLRKYIFHGNTNLVKLNHNLGFLITLFLHVKTFR